MCAPSPPKIPDPPEMAPPAPAPPPPPTPDAPLPLAAPVASSASGKEQGVLKRKKGKRQRLQQSAGGLSALTNKLGIANAPAQAATTGTKPKKKTGLNIPK